jgi:hypothetical protein
MKKIIALVVAIVAASLFVGMSAANVVKSAADARFKAIHAIAE